MSATNKYIQIFAYTPSGTTVDGWPRYNTDTTSMGDGTGDGTSGRNGEGISH